MHLKIDWGGISGQSCSAPQPVTSVTVGCSRCRKFEGLEERSLGEIRPGLQGTSPERVASVLCQVSAHQQDRNSSVDARGPEANSFLAVRANRFQNQDFLAGSVPTASQQRAAPCGYLMDACSCTTRTPTTSSRLSAGHCLEYCWNQVDACTV